MQKLCVSKLWDAGTSVNTFEWQHKWIIESDSQFKSLGSYMQKSVSSAHQGSIYSIKNTVKTVILLFIPVKQSWIFSIITPVFSVTWSFRNHSNMLKKHFLLLSMRKTVVLIHIYVEIVMLFFSILWWTKFKITVLIWNGNIINAFTVTFDQFNASLLNKH